MEHRNIVKRDGDYERGYNDEKPVQSCDKIGVFFQIFLCVTLLTHIIMQIIIVILYTKYYHSIDELLSDPRILASISNANSIPK